MYELGIYLLNLEDRAEHHILSRTPDMILWAVMHHVPGTVGI